MGRYMIFDGLGNTLYLDDSSKDHITLSRVSFDSDTFDKDETISFSKNETEVLRLLIKNGTKDYVPSARFGDIDVATYIKKIREILYSNCPKDRRNWSKSSSFICSKYKDGYKLFAITDQSDDKTHINGFPNPGNISSPRKQEKFKPYGLPKRNEHFTGRGSVISKIRKNFEKGCNIQILRGMGGVGKTQVALEYAYRYEKTYDLIHFIDAHSVSTVEASYMSFLDMYTNTAVKNGINAAQQYKDHLRERRNWLLIFDNCDFYTNEDFAIFRDRLLPQSKGHIIITSRDLEEIGNSQCIDVDCFSEDEAIKFVLSRTKSKDLAVNKEDAKKLADRLSYHPLSLEIACAYLKADTSCSIEDYITYLDEDIDMLEDEDIGRTIKNNPYDRTLKQIILHTLEKIGQNEKNEGLGKAVKELLYLSSFSYPEDIDLSVFVPDNIDPEYREYAANASEYCSVKKNRGKLVATAIKYALFKKSRNGLAIHPLQQEIIRRKILKTEEVKAYANIVFYANNSELEKMDTDWEERWSSSFMKNRTYCVIVTAEQIKWTIKDTPEGFGDDLRIADTILDGYSAGIRDEKQLVEKIEGLLTKYPLKDQNLSTLRYLAEITARYSNYIYLNNISEELSSKYYNVVIDIVRRMTELYYGGNGSYENLDVLLDALTMVITSFTYDFYLYDYLEIGLNAIRYYISQNSIDKYIAGHKTLGEHDSKRFISLFSFTESLLRGFAWSCELFKQIKRELILPKDELTVFEDLISECFESVRNKSNSKAIDDAMDNYHGIMDAVRKNKADNIDRKITTNWDIWKMFIRTSYNYYEYEIRS